MFQIVAIFTLLCSYVVAMPIRIMQHPLEKRIAYVSGIKNVRHLDDLTINQLVNVFKKHPLLIFKGVDQVSPVDFLQFITHFDPDHDKDAIQYPEEYQHQMLQPFDQFPECKHVAPRGNIELLNYETIKHIVVKPRDAFINNYVWHTDILGHDYKLPNVVTGFHILQQPLVGGDTDFISGETIYENLSQEEQYAAQNMLIEINRRKFVTNSIQTDYAGARRLEPYEEQELGTTRIPLVYAPDFDNENEIPRVLLMPSFFEKVVGWNINDSRRWLQNFMCKKVLPHRISIQWKQGDVAVFNNRRFIHSSTPARNYLDNELSAKRLLLQTFVPTKKPLLAIKPSEKHVYACYNVNWLKDQEISIISAHDHIEFAEEAAKKYNDTSIYPGQYIVSSLQQL